MITNAIASDAKRLTNVALKSKAFWGYSNELIESWREDLTVSEQMVQQMIVYKYMQDDEVVGFYILNQPENKTIELEFLFVLPKFIGKGIGKQLLYHSFEKAKSLHCLDMIVLVDPNAKYFYKSKGFVTIEKKKSSIANRFLPLMKKDLNK
ncbi:GNAT family N-acetyltransferase [uncultured Polaribacter sp.]|uniref:GNAT family N-acetyltransferase n=1 Tax=uncultured Polaribacter sp. TaxID=174711 RepID=UPI0026212965|nr:GNAT family N-acetyltransferase [uncultured Polaribacter sp.]